jgi:hypothetical protein
MQPDVETTSPFNEKTSRGTRSTPGDPKSTPACERYPNTWNPKADPPRDFERRTLKRCNAGNPIFFEAERSCVESGGLNNPRDIV